MSETSAALTHLPAVKVGGRRLSASRQKHNPHNVNDQLHTEANLQVEEDSGPVDYPRPSPPPDFVRRAKLNVETQLDPTSSSEALEASNPFGHIHNQYEEESPKTEKKNHHQMMNDLEKQSRASSNLDSKRPTRDHTEQTNPKRIDQPAGKGR